MLFCQGKLCAVGSLQHVVAEAQRQRRQQVVDFAKTLLLVGGDVGAVAHKALVGLLGQAQLFAFKPHSHALVVDGLDALKELGVEHNVVAVGRHKGCHLFGNLLHLFAVDALCQVEEHGADFVQQGAALLQGLYRIGEGRGLAVVHNGVDFGLLALHTLLEGGHIVLGLDFLKVGDAIRRVPFPEEGVVHIILVFAGRRQQQRGTADDE